MTYGIIVPAAIVCAFAASVISPAQAASVADWRHDLDQLVAHVRTTHPDPFSRVGELTFVRAVEALKDDLDELTEEQRVVRVMRIMALLGDAHSTIEPRTEAFAAWYPIRIVEFTDGYFITAAHESIAELAGARVLAIAGQPVQQAADMARDLLGADNSFGRREGVYALYNQGLMTGLGLAESDGALRLRVQLRSGRTVERRIAPRRAEAAFAPDHASLDWRFGRTEVSGPAILPSAQYVSAFRGLRGDVFRSTRDLSRPLHLSHRTLNAVALPERDAYYINLSLWHDNQQDTVTGLFERAFREIDAQRPRRLIIDLRTNVGGDGSNAWPVIRQFLDRQGERPWQDVYVLVSGRTYSASLNFLAPFLQNVPATLIGEPMGGAFNLYGDASSFTLEHTGLELRVSALRHQLSSSDDLRVAVSVDIPALFSFAEWAAGRDPAVDPILAGAEMRSIAIIARAEGGARARQVYRERRARFATSEWWRPTTEPELRRVGHDLLDAQRLEDAIAAFELSTELFPEQWRSWYNLGAALRSAGQLQAALDAFRRSAALNDPGNFNQADLIQRVIPDLEAQLTQRGNGTQQSMAQARARVNEEAGSRRLSANRDEDVFDDPDTFKLDRANIKEHLAFGRGAHNCIGAPLARLQLRVAMEELLAHTQRIELAGDIRPTRFPEIGVLSANMRFIPRATA